MGETLFPAKLGQIFCMNDRPWKAVVHWVGLGRGSVVPYGDIEFLDQLGRGCRKKKHTQFLEDEQDLVRGRKKVKVGHGKVKARQDFTRMLYKTTNKRYNDIAKMLNYKNVSNEDACKKLAEIEEGMDIGEEIVI